MRIALLEDDPELGRLVALWLEQAGYSCQVYATGARFFKELKRESFDLLLIDWTLPDTSGDKVLAWVRAEIDWPVPIMMVTARGSEQDIVDALSKGADDYAVKPLRRPELMARIAALLRRSSKFTSERQVLEFPPFTVDRGTRSIKRDGKPLELNQKEFELAAFLFDNAGRVLSRGHMLEKVWGLDPGLDTRTVDTHISRLRKKLGFGSDTDWQLSSVHGYGYRLEQRQANETEG